MFNIIKRGMGLNLSCFQDLNHAEPSFTRTASFEKSQNVAMC
nr:MAG TPA: hypothetical protein [Caudoviricetes sp.]